MRVFTHVNARSRLFPAHWASKRQPKKDGGEHREPADISSVRFPKLKACLVLERDVSYEPVIYIDSVNFAGFRNGVVRRRRIHIELNVDEHSGRAEERENARND